METSGFRLGEVGAELATLVLTDRLVGLRGSTNERPGFGKTWFVSLRAGEGSALTDLTHF